MSKDWVERWQEYSQGISDQRPGKINEEFICEQYDYRLEINQLIFNRQLIWFFSLFDLKFGSGGLNLDINLELHKEKDHRCIHTMSKSEWDGAWTKN